MIELSFYWSLLFSIASDVKRKVGQGAVPLSLGAKTKPWDGEPTLWFLGIWLEPWVKGN